MHILRGGRWAESLALAGVGVAFKVRRSPARNSDAKMAQGKTNNAQSALEAHSFRSLSRSSGGHHAISIYTDETAVQSSQHAARCRRRESHEHPTRKPRTSYEAARRRAESEPRACRRFAVLEAGYTSHSSIRPRRRGLEGEEAAHPGAAEARAASLLQMAWNAFDRGCAPKRWPGVKCKKHPIQRGDGNNL